MRVVRIAHKSKGYRELLTDPNVIADIRARAERVAEAAGDGFEVLYSPPRVRARAAVIASSRAARKKNSAENTLIRSLDAGR